MRTSRLYHQLQNLLGQPNERSKEIQIDTYYRTELFPNETIKRLFSYYQDILQKLVDYPQMKIAAFGRFPEKDGEGAE